MRTLNIVVAIAALPLFSLAQTPCENGFAAGYPCDLIDLMGFVPSSSMGGGDAEDLWGWTDPENGKEYAIVGMAASTAFVDVSSPTSPVVMGILPSHTGSSLWRDVKVHNDHAFIVSEATDHGLQVFDLTRLRDVTNPPANFTEDAHYDGFGNAHNIAINEQSGRAYAVGSNTFSGGLHILDISVPTNPTLIGSFAEDGYTHDAQIVNYSGPDATHVGKEIALCFNENTVAIVDVTDATDPLMLSNTSYGAAQYTHQGWLTEDQRYLLVNDEGDQGTINTRTYIFDCLDLDAPVLIGTHVGSSLAIDHNLYNHQGYCYQANYRAGLRILDLEDVSNGALTEVAYFDVYPSSNSAQFNGAWSVYPFFASGNVIVSHIEEGLFVLRPNLSNAPPTPPADLTLEPLRNWLKTNWYDGLHNDLGYNGAREQMYGSVDESSGQIECVYTGFQQASEFVTFPDPINAEHLVPQSFYGSLSPMRSDIWSLRPSHQSPNSARSNNPFGEVDDASAQWYGVDAQGNYFSTGTIPANADDFSELSNGVWEPRESQKGDVARAVYYFYTMYPTQAGAIAGVCDPQTLYSWHLADPVSAFELQRNDRIEAAQGNRNPYVDDPNLVFRAWYFTQAVSGCTNAAACNYNVDATADDGSCVVIGGACDDGDALTLGDVYTNCSAPNFGCQGTGPSTIWEETFGGFSNLGYGYNGNINSAAAETEWNINYGGATDYFYTSTLNGDTAFAGKDLDFDCTWTSRAINVSGFTDLQASVNLSETGNWENADFIRFEAIVDGTTQELFSVSNDFGSLQVSPVAVNSGNIVQLRVVTRTNANGEVSYFDDVRLIGVPNCDDSDGDGLCDAQDGCSDVTACNFDDLSATECLTNDACGICGGPGAVLECGCNDIPAGDCDCDGNQDDALGICGGDCVADSDGDGICDDEDECLGELDICGVCNGPGAIYACGCTEIPAGDCDCDGNQLDVLGECGGTCTADTDGDGICDDIDPCVGLTDACGICNGPGEIYACGCTEIPEGDCDCDGNQLDALGICGGDCAGDADEDGICDSDEIPGCTDPNAANFDESATDNDGSCAYIQGSFSGLSAELIAESSAGPGLNTWRVYANFSNPGADLLSVYGTPESPIDISTSTDWFQDPLGGATSNDINEALFGEFPSLNFDSWLTIGGPSASDGDIQTVGLGLEAFENGDDVTSNDVAGGSWLAIPGNVSGTSPDAEGRVLIAQLTTDGTVVFDCNIQYREPDGSTPVVVELSLVFQNGCPEDVNGSGLVDIEDILLVLMNFGCSNTCIGDLDGDGTVTVADGLQVLGAFGNFCN